MLGVIVSGPILTDEKFTAVCVILGSVIDNLLFNSVIILFTEPTFKTPATSTSL